MESVTEYHRSKDGGILVWVYVEKDRWGKRCKFMGPRIASALKKREVKKNPTIEELRK